MGLDPDVRSTFNNALQGDWDRAMDAFMTAVDERRKKAGLTDEETAQALTAGYGSEVADAWTDWIGAEL